MPAAEHVIVENHPDGFEAHGQARDFWRFKGPEAVISGPAETGKTRTALEKLDTCMWLFPGAQGAIVRKTRQSMTGSVLSTYEKKVLVPSCGVKPHGGTHPEWYDYPNGSRIWIGGMDNPTKVLSSERDIIYFNQAEEAMLQDWETLTTRATGRAGNMPYAQVIGDCNPDVPTHWIKMREQAGTLRMFESRHEDNPTLFDVETGEMTAQGRRTISVLDNLTGVRKKRLRHGLWVAAEGQVYEEFDPAVHLVNRFDIPAEWPRYWVIDFGYTNPFVWQAYAMDPDGRLWRYREIYMTGKLVEDHARDILRVAEGEPRPQAVVCDHDAEGRATLERHLGMSTTPASKAIITGIQAVQPRLRTAGDGLPRLFFVRDSLVERDPALVEKRLPTCTEEEFPGYVWNTGGGRRKGEEPVDKDNHGMDTVRYMVMHFESSSEGIYF